MKRAPHVQRIKEGYGDKFTGRRTGRLISVCCRAQAVRVIAIPANGQKDRWICPDCGQECQAVLARAQRESGSRGIARRN